MASTSKKIKNFTVTVKERGEEITFLRRIVPGCADRSYGVHVARLAGLPESLLKQASAILDNLESQDNKLSNKKIMEKVENTSEENLFTSSIINELSTLDVMSKTPLEAMEILFRLSKEAKGGN